MWRHWVRWQQSLLRWAHRSLTCPFVELKLPAAFFQYVTLPCRCLHNEYLNSMLCVLQDLDGLHERVTHVVAACPNVAVKPSLRLVVGGAIGFAAVYQDLLQSVCPTLHFLLPTCHPAPLTPCIVVLCARDRTLASRRCCQSRMLQTRCCA